mmetsp:Transcript_17324/g.41632  ORF Transcript_17324/g.41632 Transcript_17324/m.41632 type:complete len:85 (-) Transcript_17324:273-527(-)
MYSQPNIRLSVSDDTKTTQTSLCAHPSPERFCSEHIAHRPPDTHRGHNQTHTLGHTHAPTYLRVQDAVVSLRGDREREYAPNPP